MIKQECIACGFYVPKTGPHPRHCLEVHDSLVIHECLAREILEERTGLRWEEEVYSDVVTQCQSGPIGPVVPALADPCDCPPTYTNQYCAICNAEKSPSLVCTKASGSQTTPDNLRMKSTKVQTLGAVT